MKKFMFIMTLMMSVFTVGANAQSNYSGSSKFTDNMSVTLQGGVVTSFNDFFKNGSTTPIIVLGVDKYITPWLGVAVEGRTSIGTGSSELYNLHTAFDMVNVSGYVKFNLANIFAYNGTRHFFEPVVYTGLGWNHVNCSNTTSISDNYGAFDSDGLPAGKPTEYIGTIMRNSVSYRAGVEFNFNLGKTRAWGIVVNPSVVWANIDNARLDKRNGAFEVTAGVVYHFKTSNGTRSFVKAKLYDEAEVNYLKAQIADLQNRPAVVNTVEKIVTNEVTKANQVTVPFEKNSSVLTAAGKAILDQIPTGSTVSIIGAASPEGSATRNAVLSKERAQAAADYLIHNRNCEVEDAKGDDAGRVAIVTVK